MRTHKKYVPFLYLFILSSAVLIYIIVFVDPDSMPRIGNFFFSPLYFFFPIVFLTVFFLFSYLLKHQRRAMWIGFFISSFFLFRGFGFTNPLYIFLIGLIFLLLETAISKGVFKHMKNSLPKQG